MCTLHRHYAGGAEKAYHLISCWKRKVGGDPRLAALAQSIAADPELHRKRQVSNVSASFWNHLIVDYQHRAGLSELQAYSHVVMQMLYMRYLIGGRAELSAADVCSLDDMVTAQEGGAISLDQMRVVQGHLIDAMREMKFDKASIARVVRLLRTRAKQPRYWHEAMLVL